MRGDLYFALRYRLAVVAPSLSSRVLVGKIVLLVDSRVGPLVVANRWSRGRSSTAQTAAPDVQLKLLDESNHKKDKLSRGGVIKYFRSVTFGSSANAVPCERVGLHVVLGKNISPVLRAAVRRLFVED